ncbi:MAG: hypothetical protein DU481_10550 [Nitrosomonas sp.]|uniref:restriction endonuclease subunit S n=1 Tax=Nitrosomonas sp. TaxID=42353 RepID=UPI0032EE7862
MSNLPEGWVKTTIAEIATISTGSTPTTKVITNFGGITPFVKPSDLDDYFKAIVSAEQTLSDEGVQQSKLLRPGAVLVSCIGNLGKVGITAVPVVTNQQINAVEFELSIVFDRYGYYYCKTLKSWMIKNASSTTISILNKSRFSNAAFLIAPLNEQKRIADKLDSILARVDACRERLDCIPAILKRFRQAVLTAATSGKLTEEWREQFLRNINAKSLAAEIHAIHDEAGGHKMGNAAAPTEGVHDLSLEMFPDGWELVTLRDVVSPDRPITYGILKPGPELNEGIPYIRVADFPCNKLNLGTIRKTSRQIDEEFRRSRLRSGDLLLSIRGTVGRIVKIPNELAGANITQDSARLSVQPIVNRDFVFYYLQSSMAQYRMKKSVKGVAVRGINIGDVRALQLPLPSFSEQTEIVRRVEELFAYADRIEARYHAARAQTDKLTPAILAKAFRGELVPQDPNDEPASVLLDSIRASRAENALTPKPKRSRKLAAK